VAIFSAALLPALLFCHNASAMRPSKIVFLLFVLLPSVSFAQSTPTTTPPYLDPALPIEQRVNDLLSRMTIEEKISQMQDVAPGIPHLNIPAYNWWNEGLHGVARAGHATVFPQAIGLAATWDTDLLHKIGDIVSTEARAKYNDAIAHNNTGRYYGITFWSPNINIFRDPRWGRGQETYGEDPFLTGRLGVAFVTGLQGDDPHYLKTVSTPKHYAVHSGPEPLRHRFDVPVTPHDLYDTYTPAFRATVVDGRADSIMCAYNSVDGEPACANHLLFDLLRNQWGFRGYVVSDCWAISDLHQAHDFVVTLPQASALAVKAGTDLSCGPEFHALDYALMDRLLTPRDIDRAVGRLFEARFRLGMFDPPANVPWSKLTLADVDTAADRQLSLQAAHESIVLLKNERNTLPLKSSIKSIAVVGPTADSLDVLLGNYNGTPSAYTTFLDGIKKHFPNATVSFATGAPITESRAIPVPPEYFRTGGPNSKPGVNVEFFANPTLSGSPILTRVDSSINFSSYNVSPGPGIPPDNFSVRWTGELVPPVDGDYRIGAITDGGYRLYFDDKQIIDDWVRYRQRGQRSFTVLLHLQAGHAYPVRLEYFRSFRESFARLLWLPPNLVQEATALARKSDVVVAVVGITADLEGEERENSDPGFFGGDRTDITLPTTQQQLLEALATTGKPLIVVLTSGSALAVNWANDHAAAVLEAWYPGEEGGTALADVLSGDYNPSGRLPITFYSSIAQLPPFTDYSMFNRTYRYLHEPPLFPFGFGLSYSSFSYSAPVVTPGESSSPAALSVNGATGVSATKNTSSFRAESAQRGIPPSSSGAAPSGFEGAGFGFSLGRNISSDETDSPGFGLQPLKVRGSSNDSLPVFPGDSPVAISARVTNTSAIAGDEVIELYVSHPNVEGAPIRSLAGFQRIHLDAHASQTVTFTLTPRELSVVDAQGNRSVPAGPVNLWVGSGQPISFPGHAAPPGQSARFDITTSTPVPN
jgi:beta-glucosidase